MSLFSRADTSPLSQWWWTIDRDSLFCMLGLAVIGIVMVATASPPVAQYLGLSSFYFLTRHIVFLAPALFLMVGASFVPPRWVWRLSSLAFVGVLTALVLVLFAGVEIKGARRWLSLAGMSLQPSEFLKPIFAVVAAWFMAKDKQNMGQYQGILCAAGIYGLSIALLMMQPDFGMSFVLTLIFGVQVYLAGMPLRYIAVMGLFSCLALFCVYMSFDHVHSRVNRFLNPESGDTYQVEKSIEAIEQGGLIGKGPGQGSVKLHLPDAHADFIFSVAGEEMGAVALLVIIGLFLFILWRGFMRLMDQDDVFSILAGGGLLTMLGVQAFIHMGSALQLLPAKGMTLPFISYGGSSMLAIGLTMGMILAFTRKVKR